MWEFLSACALLMLATLQAYVNNENLVTAIGRNGFLVVTLFLSKFIDNQNAKQVFSLIFYLFLVEVVVRFSSGAASFQGLYSLKNSIFFPDTNFIGVVLAPAVALVWAARNKLALPAIALIVLTASRTAYIGLITYRCALRFPLTSLFGLVVALALLLVYREVIFFYLYGLDGSLATKIDIFNNSISLLSDPYRVVVGYGKTGVLMFAVDEAGQQLHVGHTLPGNISQYGLILPFFAIFFSLKFVSSSDRTPLFVYLMVIGLTGLFPYAYLGFIVILYKAAKLTSVQPTR